MYIHYICKYMYIHITLHIYYIIIHITTYIYFSEIHKFEIKLIIIFFKYNNYYH